jgi:ABC-2 type transport system ATP-binding protein
VHKGEIFGFLGVNGAGKTTTLKMLAGILAPTRGTIRMGGFDLYRYPIQAKALIGYVPDRPYLYPKFTPRELLLFIGQLYNVPGSEAASRGQALLKEYDLLAKADVLIDGLSHGMKQRLATVAALVHQPKILIIDEPMVGLDPYGARLLKRKLREYRAAGTTILLSTHSLHVAEELADRVAIIDAGVIATIGTIQEIRSQIGSDSANLEEIFLRMTTSALADEATMAEPHFD